jgi:transposase
VSTNSEGLYSSHLLTWRKQRERGELAGLTPQKRGRKSKQRNPLSVEVERLQRQVARLEGDLEKARIVIAVQKNSRRGGHLACWPETPHRVA